MNAERPDNLASWASILGSVVTVLGLLQSQLWITVFGLAVVGIAGGTFLLLQKNKKRLLLSGFQIEGLNIDSLNIANLRRRLNRSLTVQRAYHFATIDGSNLSVAWQYEGFCRVKRETVTEFSIDAESNVPFDQLECFAFDLKEDPQRTHRIRPILVGNDGISKKIAVPFLTPLVQDQPFGIVLNCVLPGCIGKGVHYYTSSLSFEQQTIPELTVHLVFVNSPPKWLRVYECGTGKAVLANELRPTNADGNTWEYIDEVLNPSGQSVRVYLYDAGDEGFPRPTAIPFNQKKRLQ